jgi:two-component system chemotaxis sensor kinase CheA
LILDIVGLAMHSNLRNIDLVENDVRSGFRTGEEVHRLLLFTNHSCEQFAIPMATVARIERIKSSEIRFIGCQNILIYRGQSLPIIRLEQSIAALPPEQESENLFVIVFRLGDREIGLVAPALKDIRDVQMLIDAKTLREPGVLGAVIVDNATTRILDLMELVRLKYADWFQEENSVHSEKVAETPTILLAEDSDFFRNHVTRTLESEGFKVIGAVDGKDAWDHLQAIFDEIDVIVTDIEMPRMNGLEFAKAVRSRENTARLPIIALTSLAGEEDKERGTLAGINEYQIKMDANRLVDAVRRLAGTTV